MIRVLAASGFAGSQYDRFIDQLVRYSVAVLCGWMHSGFIFRVLSERGRGVGPHERELEQLSWDSDLRDQLATMTAACALPKFRERALIEGGWTVEGGSNITSYFVGACLIEFPNVFRAYRAGEGRHLRSLSVQRHTYESPTCLPDAVDEVLGKQQVLNRLKDIKDPRTLAVVALTIDGYTQEEICEVLGAESTRAVEGLLYRWRQKEKKHVREAGESG